MSFKSDAQRKKFAELLKDGKITQEQHDEWHKATGTKKLPERVEKPKSSGPRSLLRKKHYSI